MKKVFSKIAKIGLRVFLGVFLLLLTTSVLISVPAVQTKVVRQLTNSLSKTLQTGVSIESVSVTWTGRVELNGVLVRDRQEDTMIYVSRLNAKLLSFSRSKNKVTLGGVELAQPYVNFVQREGEDEMNYQFLVELSRNQDSTGNPLEMLFTGLKLHNGRFVYRREGNPIPTDRDFDENDFAFNDINAEFLNFKILGDSLNFKIKKLATVEKNGLAVDHLACKAIISQNGMEYSEMLLRVGETQYEDYLAFKYKSYRDFAEFLTRVRVDANMVEANISARDLAYFSHNLDPYKHNKIRLSGHALGLVSRFKLKDFELEAGRSSYVRGSLDLKGLPDWQSSFIDLRVEELSSSPKEVEDIMQLTLQDRMKKFGEFNFKGYLTGFYSDFAADGNFRSELGHITSRINFKLLQNETADYTGRLVATDFNLGTFLDRKDLGRTSFEFDLDEGHGLTFEKLKTQFSSNISYIEYNNTRLHDIKAKGLYTDQKFDGDLWLSDPNLEFTFNGKMDFKSSVPRFDFTADIAKIDLKNLGLDSVPTQIAAQVDIQMVGDDPDNLVGFANLSMVDVIREDRSLLLKELRLQSSISDTGRSISIQSDYIAGVIQGRFSLRNLNLVYRDFLQTLFPDYYEPVELTDEIDAWADFQIRGNDLISYWSPYDVTLGDGTLRIEYDTKEESLESWGNFDFIRYEDYKMSDYDLVVRKKPHQLLNLSSEARRLEQDGKGVVDNILLNASVLPNYAEFLFDLADTSDLVALRSFGSLDFSEDSITVRFEQSTLYLEQQPWSIHADNWALYSNEGLFIGDFNLSNGDQLLYLNGMISDQKDDIIHIVTRNLDLSNFNPILAARDISLGGVSHDAIAIRQALGRPVISGNLVIDNFAVNGDTLGNLEIEAKTDRNPMIMEIHAVVTDGLFKNVEVKHGTIDLTSARGQMDLTMEAKGAAVKPFGVWFEGVASDFTGDVDAHIRVYGSFDEPFFKGEIVANSVGFKVDYLNTRYHVSDKVGLSHKSIDFRGLKLTDDFENTAEVRGQILHNRFADMYLNVAVQKADGLMVLNTTAEDNEVFYGTGFATGGASFKGPLDNIMVDVNGKTEKGTKLTIPVYDESDNAMVDYISFKKVQVDTVIRTKPIEEDETKISMNFELDLTENAEFVLLFDEVLDDKISGRGRGNIKMQYATGEDFFMYGIYNITEGIYPFSSPTLVSEKFDLREGGQIIWNGDPYNARINLQAAVARNRANPLDLMRGLVDGHEENYNTNMKVNVILNLEGELFNPELTFDWEFPESGSLANASEFNTVVRRIEADRDELNRQVFSLLTFGSFVPASNSGLAVAGGNTYRDVVSSSVGTFLSNQVNNWISDYVKDLELGVDYTTATGITDQERADLVVSVRQQLFDERIEVGGSVNTISSGGATDYNVDLTYKVKKDGSLKLKAYTKSANDPTLGQISTVTTYGVGLFFRKQFDRLGLRSKKVKPE